MYVYVLQSNGGRLAIHTVPLNNTRNTSNSNNLPTSKHVAGAASSRQQ